MCQKETFKHEEQRLTEYETLANKQLQQNETALGYRDMNSRFLRAEEESYVSNSKDYSAVKREHKRKKQLIENAWHQNTSSRVRDLKKQTQGNAKTPAYYARFSFSEMEVFLKNSDRGGNSEEYNAVATDLELYNKVMAGGDTQEGLRLLKRLKESCDYYVANKKPTFTSGKIRKAMITQLQTKAKAEIDKVQNDYISQQKNTLKDMREDKSSENVTKAFNSHHNLIRQVLNGSITLDDEKMKSLDNDMDEVLNELSKQSVDANQSKTFCTKFFNALGWSSGAPRLVSDSALDDDGEEFRNSPFKKRMYHTIGTILGQKNAAPMAEQLVGKNGGRLYYGIGRFGKGVYTSVYKDNSGTEDDAADNSFTYGSEVGSIMFKMLLNENARMTTKENVNKLEKVLEEKFPKLYKKLYDSERTQGGYKDYQTMLASLFGYNTILGDGNSKCDYLTISDRKALTVSKLVRIREEEKQSYMFSDAMDVDDLEMLNK